MSWSSVVQMQMTVHCQFVIMQGNYSQQRLGSKLLCLRQMMGCLTCLVIVPAQIASNHGFVPREQVLQQRQQLYTTLAAADMLQKLEQQHCCNQGPLQVYTLHQVPSSPNEVSASPMHAGMQTYLESGKGIRRNLKVGYLHLVKIVLEQGSFQHQPVSHAKW